MEFPYYKVKDWPQHQPRERVLPWLYVGIFNPKNESNLVYPLGLIDSGSGLTIIHQQFGEELGFNIGSGKKQKITGLGGGCIEGYLHRIGFNVSKIEEKEDREQPIIYEDWAVFTNKDFPKTNPQQTAIWGTIGFFNHLAVAFKYPETIFIIDIKDKDL